MTHFDEYKRIIDNRKQNPLPDGHYGENHHIVPKSVCPILKKSKENIVRLTAQEHFLAHYHLWLAFRDEMKEKKWAKKMCFALSRMKLQLLKCDDVETMAKLYEEARIEFGTLLSQSRKGKPRAAGTRTKIAKTLQGHSVSDESKQKNRDKHLGRRYPNRKRVSDEVRKQQSERTKGRRFYTDGIHNTFTYECPEGYWPGRTMKYNKRKPT